MRKWYNSFTEEQWELISIETIEMFLDAILAFIAYGNTMVHFTQRAVLKSFLVFPLVFAIAMISMILITKRFGWSKELSAFCTCFRGSGMQLGLFMAILRVAPVAVFPVGIITMIFIASYVQRAKRLWPTLFTSE